MSANPKPAFVKRLPELVEIEKLANKATKFGRVLEEGVVEYKGISFPLLSFSFGSQDPTAPALIFTGGVHGLERIGTRVLVAYMKSVLELLSWDETFASAISKCRLLFYPLVNPGGVYWMRRSNPNGIDLMRNAPVDAHGVPRWGIFSGHRISNTLPWYRGVAGEQMEIESQVLCNFIEREVGQAKFTMCLDMHSGFGAVDRLWFPYARSKEVFPHVSEVYAFKRMLDRTFPNHIYRVEPQSKQYTAHGDLWDYMYDRHIQTKPDQVFIPLCLEMGSWNWVKKNPRQLFSLLGAFNPVLPHRRARTLRRHLVLFDFLMKIAISNEKWAFPKPKKRAFLNKKAKRTWYAD